jgi:pimeloyl-ACP methyl ester carboxylesterase
MAGYDDEDAFDAFAETLDLRPIAGDITCPWMAIAGEDDQLSPVEHTEELFDLVKAPKRLVVYEGANHGLNEGNSVRLGENRATMVADWLKDRLDGKPAASERVFIDSAGRATVTPV